LRPARPWGWWVNPVAASPPRGRPCRGWQAIIGEPLSNFSVGTAAERRNQVAELLERVGLSARHAKCYPHEFRGGQHQRTGSPVPSPTDPPAGCRFHPRCPIAIGRAATDKPELRRIRPDREVRGHLVE